MLKMMVAIVVTMACGVSDMDRAKMETDRARMDRIEDRLDRIDRLWADQRNANEATRKGIEGLDARLKLAEFSPNWFCGMFICARDADVCKTVHAKLADASPGEPGLRDACIPRRISFCDGTGVSCFRTLEQCQRFADHKTTCAGVE